MSDAVTLTVYAVEHTLPGKPPRVFRADIRGTWDQADAIMRGRIVEGTQRIVQLTASGTWVAAVDRG